MPNSVRILITIRYHVQFILASGLQRGETCCRMNSYLRESVENMGHHLLIIEAENSLRMNLVQRLQQRGFRVSVCERTEDALALLGRGDIAVVLLGLEELKRKGISMMRVIRQHFPRVEIITINSGDQLDLSIESMRLGAYDDFLIPFDLDALMACIRDITAPYEEKTKPESRQ